MQDSKLSKRVHRTYGLCDELAQTMSDIQHRLESRRNRMRQHMDHMAKGLRIHNR